MYENYNLAQRRAYSSGADKACCGGSEGDNPYNWPDERYRAWLNGFTDTKEEMHQNVWQDVNG